MEMADRQELSKWADRGKQLDRWLIGLSGLFSAVLLLGLLPIAIQRYGSQPENARFFMGFLLIFLWVGVGGGLMRRHQAALIRGMRAYERNPRTGLVLFSVLLACIEEAVACLGTNLHALFGDPQGQVFITASANYLDLIFLHSVIVIVPLLSVWSWILGFYRFSSSRFFLLFGIQGALAEVVFTGMQPALFPTWLLVYGLMVWLPYKAFEPALERARPRRVPGIAVHAGALLLAQLGGFLFTLVFLIFSHGILKHPLSHFGP